MKCLFAIKTMSASRGGAERVLVDVTQNLAQRGHEISLLSYDPLDVKPVYPIDPAVKRIAVPIGDTSRKTTLTEMLFRIKALRRLIKQEEPDVVIGFMHSMFIPLSIALIGTGIPVIASEHIVPEHYKKRKLEYWALILCAALFWRITVLSQAVKSQYPALLRRKMVPIANAVAKAQVQARPAGATDAVKTVLSVGRLDEQKDQKTLITAFAQLSSEYPDWRLVIIGEGALRPVLEAQIKALGMEDVISLPGTTDAIFDEYAKAHLFVLSSRYESFGLATAEAMAHGLPVIGFADCPGTNELIQHGINGMLVNGPDRSAALTSTMAALMNDPPAREQLGKNGIKSMENFQIKSICDDWEALLCEAIAR